MFKLTPPAEGESSWTETLLHRFKGGADGSGPLAGLIMDTNGFLYGTTGGGGSGINCVYGCGTIFRLAPPVDGKVSWIETVLYSFPQFSSDGAFPEAGLIADTSGVLYGTTVGTSSTSAVCKNPSGAGGCGTVFKITGTGFSP